MNKDLQELREAHHGSVWAAGAEALRGRCLVRLRDPEEVVWLDRGGKRGSTAIMWAA